MAIKLSSLNIGDIIKFRVNGTPTEFIVVHQGLPSADYDSSCNGTWFLSKYFVSSGAFSSGSNSLSASSGYTYLNTTAYNTLDADIKSAIREVKIPYQNGTGTAGSVAVGANGLTTRIFLPSSTELGCTAADFAYGTPKEIGAVLSYFSGATNATRMATYPDGTAGTWWTRTPDSTSTTKQLIINTNGAGHSFSCTTSNGVRPMFIIPGDKEIELNDDGSYSIVVSKLGDIAEGSKVLLNENGTPTEFFVIRHDYQYDLNGRGRTLLMRVKCPNDSTMAWGSGFNYQASKVDTWLNDTYKYRLDNSIIVSIGQTTIKTKTSYNSSITQISRSCFLLSSTEYALTTGEGDQLTEASTKKVTTLDSGSTCYLWTRTPASSSAITTLHYTTGGSWTTKPTETYPAVRPAFTLPENIKFSKNDDGTYSMITVTPISDLAEGTIVTLNENGSPVEFYIAKHNYELELNVEPRTLLVRKNCYDARQWHTSKVDAYASSTIDTWLNNEYKTFLDSNIQEAIGSTYFYYTPGEGSYTVKTLSRSIFILSLTEIGLTASYANIEGAALPISNLLKRAYLNDTATIQWTRSPYTNNNKTVYGVNTMGLARNYSPTGNCKSRPCFTLPSSIGYTENSDGTYFINGESSRDTTTYKFVTSIESTGTQWIDTGFKPSYKTRVVADIEGINAAENFVFGVRDVANGTSPQQLGAYRRTTTTIRNFYFGTNVDATLEDASPRTIVDSNRNVLYWGDKLTITNTAVSSGICTNTLYLFAMNSVGSPIGLGSFKLYSCKIYDDDILIHDYVPCIRNGEEAGLYDKIENKFYSNAGTGEFLWYNECNRDNVDQKNMLPKAIDENGNIYNEIGYSYESDPFYYGDMMFITGFIPVLYGDEIYLRNTLFGDENTPHYGRVIYYNSNFEELDSITGGGLPVAMDCVGNANAEIIQFTIMNPTDNDIYVMDITNVAYIRLSTDYLGSDSVITVNVPINFQERKFIQYIRGTGTQYLNTEYIPSSNTRITTKAQIQSVTAQQALFGSRTKFASNGFNVFTGASNAGYQDDYGTASKTVSTPKSTGIHTLDKNKNVFSVDGTVINTSTAQTFTGAYPIYLFTINNGGSPMNASHPMKGGFYWCKIYENDILQKDFYPILLEDGTACLYEKLSGKYHKNIGTGTFTAGPETGVIMNPLMDDLKCVLIDGIPQLNYYSYSSVNSYIIERSVNNEEFEAIETKTAKTVDSCNYTDEDLGNANSVQYRVKAVSGDYESEYLYTDIYSLYKISTYTNLIVGGVL